jgi:type I restriction enzyme S subunit
MKLITDHIDLWTSTVKAKSSAGRGGGKKRELYGVKKLRELILDLAMRGLLVPQDPKDEPAKILLVRVSNKREELIKLGEIKRAKVRPISNSSTNHFLPNSWALTTLGIVGDWGAGSTPKRENSAYYGGNITWLKSGELNDCETVKESSETITDTALASGSFRKNKIGDVLIAMYGATIGKVAILARPAVTNQAVCGCSPFEGIFNRFLYFYLLSQRANFHAASEGGAQPNISKIKLLSYQFPLPPLAEQHRIVAKVDELMGLCDKLEQQTEDHIQTHETLVKTLLDTLTSASDPAQSQQAWQQIESSFDLLFTTESSIDHLKQTILQLAVMGKLVPQNPNDEPTSQLLKRIATEKAQLVKDKVFQKTSKLKEPNLNIQYPQNWIAVQIGTLCPSIVPNRDKPKSFTGNMPWVTLPDFPASSQYLNHEEVKLGLTQEEAKAYSARIIPKNSVLMSCIGRFGLTCINPVEVSSNQQIHAFIILDDLQPEYVSFCIRSSARILEEQSSSTTIAYLNKTKCESINLGLPPAAEQKRIVAKVEELMTLCDTLKAKITTSQTTQLTLTDSIVSQATN